MAKEDMRVWRECLLSIAKGLLGARQALSQALDGIEGIVEMWEEEEEEEED